MKVKSSNLIKNCSISAASSSSSSPTTIQSIWDTFNQASSKNLDSAAGTGPAVASSNNQTTLLQKGSILNRDLKMMRPNTLNVGTKDRQIYESKIFIGEALNAWSERADNNYVASEKIQSLFNELKFYPSEDQVQEMLQTAKLFARRSSNLNTTKKSQLSSKNSPGLTFGEFCVLLADLKRFRTFSITNHDSIYKKNQSNIINNKCNRNLTNNNNNNITKSSLINNANSNEKPTSYDHHEMQIELVEQQNNVTADIDDDINESVETKTNTTSDTPTPEVFLGGSCNPTTWRADVAIPALDKLGISFYNPQVSDWTPDLIELEHRAKEKARVLFFVMDSETRSSAGAIEAAHIAGQNSRHLVLVLHPYKQNQTILNEPISQQEYIDLSRNQRLLQQLVTRRGLPVLDSIPSGLQRTKAILNGLYPRDPPSNIASRLISVRRAFDRVVEESRDTINLIQCQKALNCLGYPNNILSIDNIKRILEFYLDTESCEITINENLSTGTTTIKSSSSSDFIHNQQQLHHHNNHHNNSNQHHSNQSQITFEKFCVIAAYLTVLQHEINTTSCVSPIKGFNVPPPPIFFTNTPAGSPSIPSIDEIVDELDKISICKITSPPSLHTTTIIKKINKNSNNTNVKNTTATAKIETASKNRSKNHNILNNICSMSKRIKLFKINKLWQHTKHLLDGIYTNFLKKLEYIHSQPSPRIHTPTNPPNDDTNRNYSSFIFDYQNKFSRDSGTSSPQPNEFVSKNLFHSEQNRSTTSISSSIGGGGGGGGITNQLQHHSSSSTPTVNQMTKISVNVEVEINHSHSNNSMLDDEDGGNLSDSSDSVFSSGESLDDLNFIENQNQPVCLRDNNIRDLYIGGSCMLRTKWCQDFIVPYLKEKGITYYLSNLHESLNKKKLIYNTNTNDKNINYSDNIKNNSNSDNNSYEYKNSTNDHNFVSSTTTTTTVAAATAPSTSKNYHNDATNNHDIDHNIQNCDNSSRLNISSNSNSDHVVDDDNHSNNADDDDAINDDQILLYDPKRLDSSRVLFFLITNETRSLAPMTLAAHYIGMGYNVVLCVQMLPEHCKIGTELLSPSAIKDYNRGRAYLIDLAKRQGIAVFSDPKIAIDCAIEKVNISKSRNSI